VLEAADNAPTKQNPHAEGSANWKDWNRRHHQDFTGFRPQGVGGHIVAFIESRNHGVGQSLYPPDILRLVPPGKCNASGWDFYWKFPAEIKLPISRKWQGPPRSASRLFNFERDLILLLIGGRMYPSRSPSEAPCQPLAGYSCRLTFTAVRRPRLKLCHVEPDV
jgi:hypothetical protein